MRRRLVEPVWNLISRVEEAPIIVLGHQKSGTSAIAHLLAEWAGLSTTIDIAPLWEQGGARIMRGQCSFADFVDRHRRWFSTQLIKEPMMTFFAEQVLERFPAGRFLFVVRDPRDTIRSLLNRRGLPGDLDQLGPEHLAKVEGSIIFDADLWAAEGENYVGILALRWRRAVAAYRRCVERMMLLRFEDFLADKSAFISQVGRRLGLDELGEISAILDRPFQPPGNREIGWEEFFSSANLSRIEELCRPDLADFGYAASVISSERE